MANERNTRALLETLLKEHGFVFSLKGEHKISDNCILEGEKTDNVKINALLKNASKKGSGLGRPDYIISNIKNAPNLLIICECKADTKNHESLNKDKYCDYAVDGVLLYSSFLSKEYDIISIAISGEERSDCKISTFLQLKEEKKARDLNICKIYKFEDYLDKYKKDSIKENNSYDQILKYAKQLNEKLHSLDIPHEKRSLLISGILIALRNNGFKNGFYAYDKQRQLAEYLYNTIEIELKENGIKEDKLDNMLDSYGFIKTNDKFISNSNKDILKNLVKEIKEIVHDGFLKNFKYFDVLGKFYTEFLKYTNGDKSLGIVLTPQHITDLFCEIANVTDDSVVLDNCCGTSGFLISAMRKMRALVDDSDLEKILRIYSSQLIGIEANPNMFALSCSNMMIRGDGKSNIYYGDCFEKTGLIKQRHKPNIGFLNPPYSKDKSNKSKGKNELDFVLNNLEMLQRGSICVAIVPISCCFDVSTKKTRKKILENNTLQAVMSMNGELFHNSDVGTVTCIMVFVAGIPHKSSNLSTWLADWKNDGFRKNKIEGRADLDKKWSSIKQLWLSNYRNKFCDNKTCMNIQIKQDMEWCIEAYLKTDYSKLSIENFKNTVKKYVLSQFSNGFIDAISKESIIKNMNYTHKEKSFLLKDIFYIGSVKENKKNILKSSIVKNDLKNYGLGKYPYIVTSSENNGISGLYDDYSALGNCLTIDSATVGSCFYQKENFLFSDHVEKLYPKNLEFNVFIGLYISTIINLEQFRYSYGRKFNQTRIKNTIIKLPADSKGNPDWKYMEDYIKSLPYSSNL